LNKPLSWFSLWWVKLLFVGIIAAAFAYAVHIYNEAQREIGRNEIRVEWDDQKKADAEAYLKSVKAARAEERKNANESFEISKTKLTRLENEKLALEKDLNTERFNNRRMRVITGTTLFNSETGIRLGNESGPAVNNKGSLRLNLAD